MKQLLFFIIVIGCTSNTRTNEKNIFHSEKTFTENFEYHATLKEYKIANELHSEVTLYRTPSKDIERLFFLDSLYKSSMNGDDKLLSDNELYELENPDLISINSYKRIKSFIIVRDSIGIRAPFDNLIWDEGNRILYISHLDTMIAY